MARAVLVDLDGTLIDRAPTVRAFLPTQFLRYAAPSGHSEAKYIRRFLELDANGYGSKESTYETLQHELNLRASVDDLVRDFRTNAFREVFLFPDAREVLAGLRRQGFELGIVSNGSASRQSAKIAAADLARYVDVVLTSGALWGCASPTRQSSAEPPTSFR